MSIIQVALLILMSLFSWQQDAVVEMDYTHDASAYARCVAEMTAEASFVTDARADGTCIVLCRTNGAAVDFAATNPLQIAAGPDHTYTISYRTAQDAMRAVDVLSADADVIYAECDSELTACEMPSFQSYGAERMGCGPYLNYVRNTASGSAMIAVLDSGVAPHPAISGKIVHGGHDYIDNDDDPSNDAHGHGTHVAGIIADCTQGAPVMIYPIRVLDASASGSVGNAINAIREACDRGVDVINFSLVAKSVSSALDAAVRDAVKHGVTFVAAAGNQGKDVARISPSHLQDAGVLIIGSASAAGDRSVFSNYGAAVDAYAYGESILSCSIDNGYIQKSGTSMAAPHVSALCGMMECVYGNLSPAETEARVKRAVVSQNGVKLIRLFDMYPQSYGFHLTEIRLDSDDRIAMPTRAYPQKGAGAITYSSSDPNIADVRAGVLCVDSVGSAVITANSLGLPPVRFTVEAVADKCTIIQLPNALKSLESESFFGDGGIAHIALPNGTEQIEDAAFADCAGLRTVSVPGTVTAIGENALGRAVILCPADSAAAEYAAAHDMQYIAVE